ncbi:MAG: hypothetical protein J4432_05535 [DPANN group archaeon]|nr:hypothetical protein [DPANN group archaeon]
MSTVTLEQINNGILDIKQELDEIKDYLEEEQMELSDETKKRIQESRSRPISEMKTQKEIEEKYHEL